MAVRRKITDKAHYFFPERNGVSFAPYERRNYNAETLRYMTPPTKADYLTQVMVDTIKPKLFTTEDKNYAFLNKTFLVVEVCAGIGGNTVSMLSNPHVTYVFSFEVNEERRDYLKRNIMSYKLGGKSTVYGGLTADFKMKDYFPGAMVYFDPPWLPSDIDVEKSTKTDYLKEGITVGGRTIEKILEDETGTPEKPGIYAFVAHFPPDYKMGEVKNWIIERVPPSRETPADNSTVYRGINLIADASPANPARTNYGGYGTWYQSLLTEQGRKMILANTWKETLPPPPEEVEVETPELNVSGEGKELSASGELRTAPVAEVKETPAKSKWDAYIASLPTPSSDAKDFTSSAWPAEFQRYIAKLVAPVATIDTVRNGLLESKSMTVWIEAFQSEVYNATINYEQLEIRGDAVLKYAFKKYLFARFPGIDPQVMTAYEHNFTNKRFLSSLGRALQVNKWLRITDVSMTPSVYEDLIESFFGALDKVGDTIKPGLGAVLVYNMMPLFYDHVTFDETDKYGDNKTRLEHNIGKIFGSIKKKGFTLESSKMADNNYSVTYTLSPELVERIRSLGHDTKAFPSNLTLSGFNFNKDYIVNKIAGDWLNLFDRIGLDQKRVEAVRDIKMFDGINPTSVASARDKANRAGYSEIIFKSPRSTKGIKSAAVVLLQGRNPTTKALVNLSIGTSTDGKDLPAKINAIEKYLASP